MGERAPGAGKDLWGPPFEAEPVETVLVARLNEQVNALTQRTAGRVVGEVVVKTDPDQGTVWTALYARVPALNDYKHKLIAIAHPVVIKDPSDPFPVDVFDPDGKQVIHGMADYDGWLSRILASPQIHAVINSLLRYGDDRAAS